MTDTKKPTTLLTGMPWKRHGDVASIWRSHGWTPPSEIRRRELEAKVAQIMGVLKDEPKQNVVSIYRMIRHDCPVEGPMEIEAGRSCNWCDGKEPK